MPPAQRHAPAAACLGPGISGAIKRTGDTRCALQQLGGAPRGPAGRLHPCVFVRLHIQACTLLLAHAEEGSHRVPQHMADPIAGQLAPALARGLLALLKRRGPGPVAGASANAPTTVASLAVIGATTGFALSWLVVVVIPMQIIVSKRSA